jgi:CheY-like chemotaxis protein
MSNNEFLEVGDKGALVCDEGPNANSLRHTFESLGYKCHVAGTPEEAIERMAYTTYDLVSVTEDLGGTTLDSNPALLHLKLLPMAQRRYTYSLLVGSSFRTLDAMQAFAHSVHLVVNNADVSNLAPVLKRGLADFERMYATYRDVLRENGELAYDRRRH